jgi:putative DNA primase/helicase
MLTGDIERIREALNFIPAHDRDTWVRMGMGIKSELGDAGFDVWDQWSQQDDSYDRRAAKDVWKSIHASGKVTAGTLFHLAKANGWRDDGTYRIPAPEELALRRQDAAQRATQELTEIERQRADTANKAAVIWTAATEARADHPYLQRKQVSPVTTLREIQADAVAVILDYAPKSGDVPLAGRLLVIPVKINGMLSTLELIDGAGRKSALPGRGTKAGGYWQAQALPAGIGEGLTLLIGEGVATGLSAGEASGNPAIAALSNTNLPTVAQTMRERYPAAELVVLADLVKATGDPDPRAIEAARISGAKLAVPQFGADRPPSAKDFNDMAQFCGADGVARAIAHARAPEMQPRDDASVAMPTAIADGPVPLVRPMAPPDPYPVEALGPQLARVTQALHQIVQSPIAMCANSVLAAVTLAAQAHVNVELPFGNGSVRPVSNYLVTVGRSGERKSATDELVMRPVYAHEAQLRVLYDIELKAWRDAHDAWESARRAILASKGDAISKKADLEALGDEPEHPLTPIMTMEEPTIEGLAKLLMSGQPSAGVFSTEGGQFVGGHAMSDEAKLRGAAALSRLWDGEPWKRVRSLDGAHTIANKRLAIHLMAQPDVAALLVNDPVLRDQGLTARMLVTYPTTTMGTRLHRAASPESLSAIAAFNDQMTQTLAIKLPLRDGTRNELAPRTLRLSTSARESWIGFNDHIERMIGPGGALEPISGFAAKMGEHVGRLAAVMTWWSNHDATVIDREILTGAIQLVEHYADEALRIYQASVIPLDIAEAQRLLEWLVSRWVEPHVSVPDICQLGPNSVRVAKRAKELVKILEDHRWLIKVEGGAVINGQRRREAWSISRSM